MLLVLAVCYEEKSNETNNILEKEVTIAVWNGELRLHGEEVGPIINDNMAKFKADKDINVKYDIIYANTYEEYLNKLNIKLYKENGPTLIYFYNEDYRGSAINYIKQGVALEVEEDKLPNVNKLYDIFKEDSIYYIPIGMNYPAVVLNKPMLDRLNIKEPDINWTKKDFTDMREKWISSKERIFSSDEYSYIVRYPYYELSIIDKEKKKINLNTDSIKEFLKKSKEKLSSSEYKFIEDLEFYYNAIFEYRSKECKKEYHQIERYNEEYLIASNETENTLKVRPRRRANKDFIIVPNPYSKRLNTFGFIVNKRGKNIEVGLEFINQLLSDENQIKVYTDDVYWFYPVNKEIEDKINKKARERDVEEKYITMRKHVLDKIKSGDDMNYLGEDVKVQYIRESIEKDFFKIIFSDEEYTDEELENKLIEMENKYQLYFRE